MTGFNSKRDAAADKDALFEKLEVEQPAQEPVAYAGIKMWVGDHRVVQYITQTELHYSREPWLHLLMKAEKCVAALKEKNG